MTIQHDNSISHFISKSPKGRRFVVGDIHGCWQTFRILVEETLKITPEDQLFLLGDYIDRGPDSGAVIDYILKLQREGYQVYPLRGNHEKMLLEAIEEARDDLAFLSEYLQLNETHGMTNEQGKIKAHYLEFIEALPYFYELDEFMLVHAGFNWQIPNPFEDTESMVWIRIHEHNTTFLGNKRLIHGHTPTRWENIRDAIKEKEMVLPLDNGCVFAPLVREYGLGRMGRLCAFDIDTFELIMEENKETKRIGE